MNALSRQNVCQWKSGSVAVVALIPGQETRPEPRPQCQKHQGRCGSHPSKWLETAPAELWDGLRNVLMLYQGLLGQGKLLDIFS